MSDLPSKADLIRWIEDNPEKARKRDIARAFGLKGDARVELNDLLRELRRDGSIQAKPERRRKSDQLPPVAVLTVIGPDSDGDLIAEPLDPKDGSDAPKVVISPGRDGAAAVGPGDRILARIAPLTDQKYPFEGRIIRKIGSGPTRILGLYRKGAEGGRIVSIDRKSDHEWRVPDGEVNGAKDGELVNASLIDGKQRFGPPRARITEVLGDPMAPKSVSLYAIHTHGVPDEFSDEVILEAEQARPVPLGRREDLRDLPLVTIDPVDARDRDDAVLAHADGDPANAGGHVVWVAIADVAHYVRPGSRLDREARLRGNSTYFPDRVVPMLPDALSGDLCSLHDGVDRPCLAVRMVLNAAGRRIGHRFTRGLMRSRASLNYQQVQSARDGAPDAMTEKLVEPVIAPLYAAYEAAQKERNNRQPLHLDLPERRIELSEDGHVTSVAFRERFDAHRLIEEFMILANVSAAETLEAKRRPFLYRVHEEPSPEKLDGLRDVAHAAGLVLAKGQVLKPQHLNRLLDSAAGTDNAEIINMSVLRAMTQAYYAPHNFGHFGLNLKRYAHFTSPIRRYADVIVHRALIAAHGWGKDGLSPADIDRLEETGEVISMAERRSMMAERDTNDRYLASYLSERVGGEFDGRISGIARFGLFVKLIETGADGLVPISTLGREYFHHDADQQTLTGEQSRLVLKLGQPVTVRLAEAVPITGGLMFELLSVDGKPMPRTSSKGKTRGSARKLAAHRKKQSQLRKVERRRK